MSAVEKIAFANAVGGALIANDSFFDAPPIAGADLIDFATSVSNAITAANAAKATYHSLIAAQNDLLKQLDGFMRQTGSYVQNISAGDAAIIQLAGLSVKKPSEPVGRLDAPTSVTVVPNRNAGEVALKWKPIKGAKCYHIQFATDMSFAAGAVGDSTFSRASGKITGLTTATRYWFRIAAIGAAGPSTWSNPVGVVTQ